MFATRQLTEDGLERTFALNHMPYFVLTAGLRERLLAFGAARIINTASEAHRGASLGIDDLQFAKGYGAMKAYNRSKLCNILFTRELARRLRGTGMTANCLHPGFVATRFADQSGGLISSLVWLAKFFAISPAKGAETIVYLASSANVAGTTGEYFYKCLPTKPSTRALDDRAGGNWTPEGILQLEGEANFSLSWAHEAHPKTTLYGVVFQKLNGPLLTSAPQSPSGQGLACSCSHRVIRRSLPVVQ
jgi:hypothetical protein